MTAKRTTSARKDTFPPARLYWPVRWRLHWIARHDRRAGLPVGLSAQTTPLLRELVACRDQACEQVRARYHADVQAIDVRLAAVDVELAALGRSLDEATVAAVRAAVPPTEQDLTRRRVGERNAPVELVRERRAREHGRTAEAARERQADIRRRLSAVLAEEAELEARRRNRSELARSQALGFVEHADRLAAVYRRALLRRHPQRDALLSRWSSDLSAPPSWLLADDLSSRTCGSGAAA